MVKKTDIVSLSWVLGLVSRQAELAEAALREVGEDSGREEALLRSGQSVIQITSALHVLGIYKGELLCIEIERGIEALRRNIVAGEHRKLMMAGLQQALKIIPAYLAHVQAVRLDTGQGLEQYVNDLRRWLGLRPFPQALFFHLDYPPEAGITRGAQPVPDDEIRSRANVMLALYLEMARSALRQQDTGESMKTVARIARKMQLLFAGTSQERFWFTLIGICEGIAGGLIVPDECIARIFKAGAFMIKFARENGAGIDPGIDSDDYQQQMLFYMAACRATPVHIAGIRRSFGIDSHTLEDYRRGLSQIDNLVTSISDALDRLNGVLNVLTGLDERSRVALLSSDELAPVLEGIDTARRRLSAAGQNVHAESLHAVHVKLRNLSGGKFGRDDRQLEQVFTAIVTGVADVRTDLQFKLEHGVCTASCGNEFELRESVVAATFKQMSLVENTLHVLLRRKALAAALKRKPRTPQERLQLTTALHRYLNKSDQGHEELRRVVWAVDSGSGDPERLYELACKFLRQMQRQDRGERESIASAIQLLAEISGALSFVGLEREGAIMEGCREWLEAASKAGAVREDEAFRSFADAFARIELHLQRSVIDPLEDTSHLLALAEQRVAQLRAHMSGLSSGADVVVAPRAVVKHQVKDEEIAPEFRQAFIEESEEIAVALEQLVPRWRDVPADEDCLREIRRHFHTFKGNGRAVGANVLGELGWAAQDLLDRVLEGELPASDPLQELVSEVVAALPGLVDSYRQENGRDLLTTRDLTNRCFRMARCAGEALSGELSHGDGAVVPLRPEDREPPIIDPPGH